MNNLNFDTHKFVEDMVEAKMPKAQAEVLVNACVVWLNGSTATKNYLNNLEKRFGDNLEHSRQLLEGKIEAVRAEIKQSEQRLQSEIEVVRAEIKQSEQLLEEKIEAVRAEIKQSEQLLEEKIEAVRAEIKQSEQRLWIRMLVAHIALGGLIIGALGVFFAALQY